MMVKGEYVCLNGEFLSSNQPIIMTQNCDFKQGFVFVEEMFASGSTIFFFEDHYKNIRNVFDLLKISFPERISDSLILKKEIGKLFSRNRFYQGVKICITFFFKPSEGLNLGEGNYLIEFEKHDKANFQLNHSGLKLNLFNDFIKQRNPIANTTLACFFPYPLAINYCKKWMVDNCIIMNDRNFVVECLNASIFILKGSTLFTPALESGAINRVIRNKILECAEKLNMNWFESENIVITDLLEADEIFLANALGLKWVLAFKDRRYYNKIAKEFANKLNQMINL